MRQALPALLFFVAVTALSPLLGYEYKEIVGTASPLTIHSRPADSSPVLMSLPKDQSVVFLGQRNGWIEVATPEGNKKGWVRSEDATSFSAPETYEFHVNRDRMVQMARDFVAKGGPHKGEAGAADTSFTFVGSVFGRTCKSGKPELVLVSFKQPAPGERINVDLEQTLGGVRVLKEARSRNHTDWWELDDLRESGLGCDDGR